MLSCDGRIRLAGYRDGIALSPANRDQDRRAIMTMLWAEGFAHIQADFNSRLPRLVEAGQVLVYESLGQSGWVMEGMIAFELHDYAFAKYRDPLESAFKFVVLRGLLVRAEARGHHVANRLVGAAQLRGMLRSQYTGAPAIGAVAAIHGDNLDAVRFAERCDALVVETGDPIVHFDEPLRAFATAIHERLSERGDAHRFLVATLPTWRLVNAAQLYCLGVIGQAVIERGVVERVYYDLGDPLREELWYGAVHLAKLHPGYLARFGLDPSGPDRNNIWGIDMAPAKRRRRRLDGDEDSNDGND